MREEAISNSERTFIEEALKASLRIDGRSPKQPRKVEIVARPTSGCVEVSVGATRAVASVQVDAVLPYPDRPSEGMMSFAVEFSASASEKFAYEYGLMGGATGTAEETVLLTRAVESAIRDSKALDTESLCILSGHLVLDYCGNASDAVQIAAIAALKHASRPDVTISGMEVTVHPKTHREPVPIPVHHVPISTSFAIFDEGGAVLVDPSLEEELAEKGKLTIVVNSHDQVCGVHKAGGASIEPGLLMEAVKVARRRAKEVVGHLGKVLADKSVQTAAAATAIVDPTPKIEKLKIENGDAIMAERQQSVVKNQEREAGDKNKGTDNLAVRPDADGLIQEGDAAQAQSAAPMDVVPKPPAPDAANARPGRAETGEVPSAKSTQAPRKDDESSEDSESDEDLMAAVISRPRGGGGRRQKPKGKG